MIDIVSIIALLGCLVVAVKKKKTSKINWIISKLVLEILLLLGSPVSNAEEFLTEERAELKALSEGGTAINVEWVISTLPLLLPPVVEQLVEEFVLED